MTEIAASTPSRRWSRRSERDGSDGSQVVGKASALLDAAVGADLLVVGCRRPFGRLGPVPHAMLHHAPCPVAVVSD